MSSVKFLLPVSVLSLAGCVTANPRAQLPALQSQLSSRVDAPVAWPITAEEREQTDASVRDLLSRDLTVESAVKIALLYNRSLRATFEELGLSQADLAAATRLPNPTLSAQLRWPQHAPRGPDAEFALTAPLLESILLPLRRRLVEEQVAQTQRQIAYDVLELVAEVRAAAYGVLAQQEIVLRLSELAQATTAAADLAHRQFEAGNIARLNLAEAEAGAQQAQLDVMQAAAEARSARERLSRWLGLTGEQTHWRLAGELPPLPTNDPSGPGLEALAIRERLDLAATRSQVATAAAALKQRRQTRYLPGTVDLGIDTERNPDGSRVTGPRLDLQLPIFDQGQPEIARLAGRLRQAQAGAEALEADIGSEVRSACDRVTAARATAEYFQTTLLPQRRLILQEMLLHYNAMQKSPYELLLAKEQLQTAERASVEARRDYWLARTELERAVGGRLPDAHP